MKRAVRNLLWLPATNVVRLLPDTFWEWRRNAASRLAAALAFYTVFSLAPTLIIALAIAGAVLGEGQVHSQVLTGLESVLGTTPALFVLGVADAAQRGLTGPWALTAAGAMLFGATVVFAELHQALNEVWEVESRRGVKGFFYRRLVGFLMVLIAGLLLLASLIAEAALSAMGRVFEELVGSSTELWQAVHFLTTLLLVTFLFALMYRLLPDTHVAWRDVLPASIVTSLLFAVGKFLIGLYLANTMLSSVYGAAGSFVIILLWIYYSAQIFLFGAQLSHTYATRFGSRT